MQRRAQMIVLMLWLASVSGIIFAEEVTTKENIATEIPTTEEAIITEKTTTTEESISENLYRGVEHTNILKIKGGYTIMMDPYLSPLRYSGHEIGIGNEWWQKFSKTPIKNHDHMTGGWEHVGRVDAAGCKAMNAAKTNYLYGLDIQGGWGAFYHWQWSHIGCEVLVGPYLEADFGVRQHASNINKPYSFDAAIDAEVMAGFGYRFDGRKTSYRLRYLVRSNALGMNWTPEYWQSYYEVVEKVPGKIQCTGPWNRNVVRHELTMDFQFVHSTWRIGAEHEWMRYSTKNMDWNRQSIRVLIGCIWNYKIEGGKRL